LVGVRAAAAGGAAWSAWEGPIDDVVIFNTVEDVTAVMNATQAEMLEPATLALLAVGGLLTLRRRRAA